MSRGKDLTLSERLRRVFTHNVALKLTSIAIAILMFSFVHGAEDAQRSVWVDVVALTPPEDSGKMLVTELPDRVRLIISGSRSIVNSVRADTLPPVTIDLIEGTITRYSFFDQEFDLPAGISITLIDPASIPLEWARRLERRVPIVANLTGAPAVGLAMGRPASVDPATVLLSGPAADVEPIRLVHTAELALADLPVGRQEHRLGLERPVGRVRYEDEVPVRVTVDVIPDLAERTIEGLEIVAVGGLVRSLRPERVDVVLRGSPAAIDMVDPAHLVPVVHVADVDPAAGAFPVAVELRGVPEGVEVLRIEAAEVLVTRAPAPGRVTIPLP